MKRILTIAFALAALVAMSAVMAGDAGTSSDPLISRAYLEGQFHDTLIAEDSQRADSKLDAAYNSAVAKLNGGAYSGGYTIAPKPELVALSAGKTVRLKTGGSITVLSGSASAIIEKGVLINLTKGVELASLSQTTVRERIFCAENTEATFTAGSETRALIDGSYITDGKVRANHPLFKDVNNFDWYYDAVDYGYNSGLFAGNGAGLFLPSNLMTRGMFVTVLHNMAGKPVAETATQLFADVTDPSEWYFNAVVWAKTNSIVAGSPEGEFRPDETITREEMAFIMRNYAAYRQFDVTPPDGSAIDRFKDSADVSAYARDALKWAVSAGIVSGTGEGNLLPQGAASRAEVSQIILNFRLKYT